MFLLKTNILGCSSAFVLVGRLLWLQIQPCPFYKLTSGEREKQVKQIPQRGLYGSKWYLICFEFVLMQFYSSVPWRLFMLLGSYYKYTAFVTVRNLK